MLAALALCAIIAAANVCSSDTCMSMARVRIECGTGTVYITGLRDYKQLVLGLLAKRSS